MELPILCDIIIPTHGQCGYTQRCLDSLNRSEQIDRCRLIWVDNASPAGDRKVVLWLLSQPGTLKHQDFLLPENLGFVKAVNLGLAFSTAPYVLLLNNDTELPADWFPKLRAGLEEFPTVGMIGPLSDCPTYPQGDGQPQWQGNRRRILNWAETPGETERGVRILRWPDAMIAFFCCLLRREVIQQVGYLSEIYGVGLGDDDDYCRRVRSARWFCALRIDLIVTHYHRTTFRSLYSAEEIRKLEAEGLDRFHKATRGVGG